MLCMAALWAAIAVFLVGLSRGARSEDWRDVKGEELEAGWESAGRSFKVERDRFVKDGKNWTMLSGEIHYFRIVPEYWEDRLERMKVMGLNAVTVYVAWNWHEAENGVFDFESPDRDLGEFLRIAQRKNLLVLLRPGPYICAEWDFGGLPSWLNENGTIKVRTQVEPFISFVDRFFENLMAIIKPLRYVEHGGPVVMVQIENEYGSFGNTAADKSDESYIRHLVELNRRLLGNNVVLYTTDPGENMLRGSLKGGSVISMFDGCEHVEKQAALQLTLNPEGMNPVLCTETYTGWLTHWFEPHLARRGSQSLVQLVKSVLHARNDTGGVSLYMAHGGTNWGFWSGANGGGNEYIAHITSYDYNAPVAEGGENSIGSDGVDKFLVLQTLFRTYHEQSLPPARALPRREALDSVQLDLQASFFDNLDALTVKSVDGLFYGEQFGCHQGFLVYETAVTQKASSLEASFLKIGEFHDRALVFVNRTKVATLYRGNKGDMDKSIEISPQVVSAGFTLTILVEHMGRINFFDKQVDERFGLLGQVVLDGQRIQSPWKTMCVNLSSASLDKVSWVPRSDDAPAPLLLRGSFHFDAQADTYLTMENLGKGVALVNRFNLGRYWTGVSPQRTLYVPGPRTRVGPNELVLFELEKPSGTLRSFNHSVFD